MYSIEDVLQHRTKYQELYHRIFSDVFWGLLDRATKKMRGLTLGYDNEKNIVQIEIFFDSELTEEEEEEMQIMDTEIIADVYQLIESTDLILTVIPISEPLVGKHRNWGWIYLRREY